MSTFLHVVELLLTNDDAKAAYADDPSTFLDGHGLGSLDSADVSDAMAHAADALPLPVAVLLDPEAGLDSAAELDLGAQGLSLERDPIELEESADPFGADVDFDTPDDVPETGDVVEDLPIDDAAGTPELIDDTDANSLDEPIDVLDSDIPDGADYLTETLLEDSYEEAVLDSIGDSLGGDHAVDHLDTDLTDDLPDDFDLLD